MRGLLLTAGILLAGIAYAQEVPSISGWKKQEQDGRYIFTPVTLISSHFTYELMPLMTDRNSELDKWLEQTAAKNMQSLGYATPAANKAHSAKVQSFDTYSVQTSDQSGKQWMLYYMAYRKPDGGIRYAKITTLAGPKSPYLNTAIKHFIELSKKEGIVLTAGNKNSNSSTANPGSNKSSESKSTITSTKKTTPVTAPGQGLRSSDIKGVVINQEYGFGVGGMTIIEYNPYLMLANGTVYKYPEVAPYDLDVPVSKTAEPNKWGTWKLDGKTMVVTLPEKGVMKTERWDNWFWTKAPKPGEKIKGAYTTIGGGGNTAMGGNTMVVYSNTIHFNDKGQFTMQKMGGGSNTDFDVSTSAYSKSNAAGTYTLNGYSIEMRYNNGEVVRKLFYFYPDSRTTFGIGGSAYVPDE